MIFLFHCLWSWLQNGLHIQLQSWHFLLWTLVEPPSGTLIKIVNYAPVKHRHFFFFVFQIALQPNLFCLIFLWLTLDLSQTYLCFIGFFWSSKCQIQLVLSLSNFQPFLAYQHWRSQIWKAPKVGPSPIHNISQSSPCIFLEHHRFIISCFVLKSHNVTIWDKQENHIYIHYYRPSVHKLCTWYRLNHETVWL